MKSARNQLILLGLICQGLSWTDVAAPLAYTLLWMACLALPRKPVVLSSQSEGVALAGGSVLSYFLTLLTGSSSHFFIGHGLALLQAVRLLRPLTRREKNFSFLIACFHIAVGCSVILDFRFLLILGAAVVLIPRSLLEQELESFPAPVHAIRKWPTVTSYLIIGGTSLFFFIAFPRGWLPPPVPLQSIRSPLGGTLLDPVLDAGRSGSQESDLILFQVQGTGIEYLRCHALTEFDGAYWRPAPRGKVRPLGVPDEAERVGTLHRRVRLKHPAFLAKVLPSDGRVAGIQGKFFKTPLVTRHGMVEVQTLWNTQNNVYEYWTEPGFSAERLTPAEEAECTRHPPLSPRLRDWLDEVVGQEEEPREIALKLEAHLQQHYRYKLGTPRLSRFRPVEEFLLEAREGHCERFASALAVLLRARGIPSRVVIGYLSNSKNWFSGWHNVRVKDAHAWVEAYLPGSGWISLDPTPLAEMPAASSTWTDLWETLDFIWYSQIVGFDAATQQQVFSSSFESLREAADWVWENGTFILELSGVVILLIIWSRLRSRSASVNPAAPLDRSRQVAAHYYARMLRELARAGIPRPPQTTPVELLERLEVSGGPLAQPARVITGYFCASRYGNEVLQPADLEKIEKALAALRTAVAGLHDSRIRAS